MPPTGRIPLIQKGVTQGCLLSCDDEHLHEDAKNIILQGRAVAAHREKPISASHNLVVLSQDCDINNANDHYIEVLAIKPVPTSKISDPQQRNRNYRKLQLPIDNVFWLFEAELISIVPKASLEEQNLLIKSTLNERSLQIMIDWRVGRYNRLPFPDKFNQEFLTHYVKNSSYDLGTYLESNHDHIVNIYVYVQPSDEDQAEEYRVTLTALIDENCSGALENEIRDVLTQHCQALHDLPNSLKMSQIDDSFAPAIEEEVNQEIVLRPSEFTIADANKLRRITLDFLCYSDE